MSFNGLGVVFLCDLETVAQLQESFRSSLLVPGSNDGALDDGCLPAMWLDDIKKID